jgi:hypothetical protein
LSFGDYINRCDTCFCENFIRWQDALGNIDCGITNDGWCLNDIRRIKCPDAGNWTIISSDNEVLDFARQHKMKTLKSTDFAGQMRLEPRQQDSRGDSIHVQVSSDEVDEWLDIFGE